MSTLNIIIPTFNNGACIEPTLRALYAQTLLTGTTAHVLISDDGSTDDTLQRIEQLPLPHHWTLQVIRGEHTGAGVARNRALAQATGEIVLLLGADIQLRPGALAAHVQFHADNPGVLAAALGFVMWHPEVHPTPLMEWMTHGGQQNNYDALLGVSVADPAHFFYGSHLSLKRAALPQAPFAAQFVAYGWEDLELGRRLAAQGLELHVLPQARALHRHYYSAAAILDRQRALGQGLRVYQRLHPEVALLPPLTRGRRCKIRVARYTGMRRLAGFLLEVLGSRWSLPHFFSLVTRLSFWEGVDWGEGMPVYTGSTKT